MAESCRLAPTIKVRKGTKIEERDSQLFARIKEATDNNYETSWKMWAYTHTKEFIDKYRDKVQYDELGEVTFSSFVKVLGLQEAYNNSKTIKEAEKDYGFDKTVFENGEQAVEALNNFNRKEKKLIAVSTKTSEGYKIKVLPKRGSTIEQAKKQSYNNALTKEIITFLNTLGFNVNWVTDPEYDGLFNPEEATLFNGLINIINLAKGLRGEQALPEEFSHLMIEGLIDHPLVQRLLNGLNSDQIQEILGEDYDNYVQQYDNDGLKLKKEAAGKLLAQFISNQGTISEQVIRPKRPLLSRIWNWIKDFFSKISGKQLETLQNNAYDNIREIYNLIASGEAIPMISKQSILNAQNLYKLSEKYNSLLKVSNIGEFTLAKLWKLEKDQGIYNRETANNLKKLKDLNESDREYEGITLFLKDSINRLKSLASETDAIKKKEKEGALTDIRKINEAAKIIRHISDFVQGYKETLSIIATFDEKDNVEQLQLPSEESAQILTSLANDCLNIINDLEIWKNDTATNILYYALRTVVKDDRVRGIGSRRNEIMDLTVILDHAERDINVIDRWFSAMSDADDALLTLLDAIVKNQQGERDLELIEWRGRIAAADQKLRKAGFNSDFIFERDENGVPTGRLLSEYDFDAYNEDLKKAIKKYRDLQEEKKFSDQHYRQLLIRWKKKRDKNGNPRLIKVFVDPKIDALYRAQGEKAVPDDAVYEIMPNPEFYSGNKNRIENLSEAQKEYYYEMMQIKREMMKKIPHRGQGIYKVIYISKDFIEGIIGNTTSNPLSASWESIKKNFIRRPDDLGFGISDDFPDRIKHILTIEKDPQKATDSILQTLNDELDSDILAAINPRRIRRIIKNNKDNTDKAADEIIEAIQSENFYLIDTDFAGHKIQKLPVYYTRRLNNMRMLSTDFSGAMMAYTAMAVNYQKMNEVVDILEVAREFVRERDVREIDSNKPVVSIFNALGKSYKEYVNKAGTHSNISGRLDDYIDSVLYEKRKKSEGGTTIFGVTFDNAKTLDAIRSYSGVLGLGWNWFSTVSNITVGKLQQWIEAAAGEYFNLKDYAWAVWNYPQLLAPYLAELNSPVKKSKLSLLIQMFDPMGDYFESLRSSRFNKSAVSRILGSGLLAYFGMNAGEHLLHCQTMLAILHHTKLKDNTTGEEITLYDALEVKEVNGITKLVLKDNLSYERDMIDNTGNAKTNKNYGKPLRDEKGKIKTETIHLKGLNDNVTQQYIIKKKKIIRKVNDSLNGAFGINDRGSLNKWAFWRLVMQYRQWMPAHYMRRFARAHYDADLERWREGYYTTVIKLTNQLIKEVKHGQFEWNVFKDQLSEHEKANLRRAGAEISFFVILGTLCRLGGRVKDRSRDWLDKNILYQIHRMYLETGASVPSGQFFDNIFQIVQSPVPSLPKFQSILKVLEFWNMFDEVQSGRYQGWSEWERDAFQLVPLVPQYIKARDFDDSMFSMFDESTFSWSQAA